VLLLATPRRLLLCGGRQDFPHGPVATLTALKSPAYVAGGAAAGLLMMVVLLPKLIWWPNVTLWVCKKRST
jgi:hypothetical protein